ncbi:MAG: hypothetical protein HDR11_09280 [Lachnospiraceae bacterium]|nr:hypothetical protein [Lachnospiraceae bacterium]
MDKENKFFPSESFPAILYSALNHTYLSHACLSDDNRYAAVKHFHQAQDSNDSLHTSACGKSNPESNANNTPNIRYLVLDTAKYEIHDEIFPNRRFSLCRHISIFLNGCLFWRLVHYMRPAVSSQVETYCHLPHTFALLFWPQLPNVIFGMP